MKRFIGGLLVLGVLVPAFAFADDAQEEAIKKDRRRIAGTWKIVGLVVDGNETNKENLKNLIVVNAPDGTWSLRSDGKEVSKGGSTIDPAKKPKTIDFTPSGGGANGKEYLGIYQVGKNRRKLCFAPAEYGRPAKFSSEAGSRSILVTFQRTEAE